MISIKETVSLKGLQSQSLLAILIANDTYKEHGFDCVITSANDSEHSHGSLHYTGAALDFRTRDIPQEQQEQITRALQSRLGREYDVVLESNHIHVEYQPKV